MRILQHLLRYEFIPPKGIEHVLGVNERQSTILLKGLVDEIRHAVRVDIGNIISLQIDERGQHKDFALEKIQQALSPWPECWLEGSTPTSFTAKRDGSISEGVSSARVGIHCSFGPASDWHNGLRARGAPSETLPNDGEYGLMTHLWVMPEGYLRPHGPILAGWLVLNGNGEVVNEYKRRWRFQYLDEYSLDQRKIDKETIEQHHGSCITQGIELPLFVFQFANCRNVEAIEVLPSRQQRRLAERRGEPLFKHYVLAIDANTQRKVYPKGHPVPSNKRLHICRGHFATYTEAAPLFGKLTGRFWVPAHVRGKPDAGMVGKDYSIKAPAR